MKKLVLLIALPFILAGCLQKEKEKEKSLVIELNFKEFPEKYTCDGEDISPQIKIYGLSDEVKSIAIIVDDIDAGKFVHWLIWNIKATDTIPEGIPKEKTVTSPIKAVQGKNDFGKIGYNGPCPPHGKHRYYFRVYALDKMLNFSGEDRKSLEEAMKGHVIQYGETFATYERKYL